MKPYCWRFESLVGRSLFFFPKYITYFVKLFETTTGRHARVEELFYLNTKGIAFKCVSCPLVIQKQDAGVGGEIYTHQPFISAQFSSFGGQRTLYGKHPKHPNFRQLDSPFNQVSPNRDCNQVSHYEYHSHHQSGTDHGVGCITAHYWLGINFQLEGLWRTARIKAGRGPGDFNV